MLLTALIVSYLDDKQRVRVLSPNTVKQYTFALVKLSQWLQLQTGHAPTLCDFTTEHLHAYFIYLRDVKHFTRTLQLIWRVLINFAQWAVKTRRLERFPVPDVELPRWKAPKPQHVNDAEAVALIKACQRFQSPYKRVMVHALMLVLTTTCLRHDEITELRVEDVSVDDYWIEVQKGKGDKYRRFKMNDQCVSALRAYLDVRPKDCQHDYLFARNRTWRVGYQGLWTLLEEVKVLADLGNADYIKPHRLRHAAASRQHQNGASVEAMKTILGHSSLLTTQIYLHTSEDHLEAVRNLSSLPMGESAPPAPPLPAVPLPPARDIAAPGQDKRLSRRKSIRIPR